ncbi:MAG: adenylyltransferase/cytidyltransferase family protein [Firmicutes bacterium]|nr:adenylyltransferase/cytidyltransferase family protein [Bacillota bacterium]
MILKKSALQKEIQKWRAAGQKIVLTNGCFDLIHVGHLRTFREAKKLGDILIVGINSDQSVQSLKGPTRPIISENERAELVAALKPVDHVIIFEELNVSDLLELVRPDYYVKGGDYSLETLPERDAIVRLNIKLKIIPLVQGISTSELVKKIRNANI